ncbi:MAG: signal peptidase I [Bacillota bacterium]|nr:signal peptidase I [Bacillota bacterium]
MSDNNYDPFHRPQADKERREQPSYSIITAADHGLDSAGRAPAQEPPAEYLRAPAAHTTSSGISVIRPEDLKKQAEPQAKSGSGIWDYIKILLLAMVIALFLRAFVFEITRVEGASMYPSLVEGDNLFTSKIAYLFAEPERGDIVVLNAPGLPSEHYIKRIIGLPNEKVEIIQGQVFIDGVLLEEAYLADQYTVVDTEIIVPEGCYFVMGDNRDVSHDSRYNDIGTIPLDEIKGKAKLRLFPFSEFGSLY